MKLNRFRNEFANNQVNLNQQLNDISWSVTSDKRKLCLGLESVAFCALWGVSKLPSSCARTVLPKRHGHEDKRQNLLRLSLNHRQLLFLSTITADKHLSNNQSIRDQRSKIRGVSVFCVSISVSLCSTFVLLRKNT